MTARDTLRAMRERASRATPGRWKIWGMTVLADQDGSGLVDHAVDVAHTVMHDEHGKPRTFDAQFIAHARTDVPALVEALEKVLAMHWRDTYSDCGRCHVAFPCATVTAIETALGGAS